MFTVILCGASSIASARVRPAMPALAVTTCARSGAPIAPVSPPMLIIEPASLFLIGSRQAFTQWNAPSRMTPVMNRQSSKVMCSMAFS